MEKDASADIGNEIGISFCDSHVKFYIGFISCGLNMSH